MTEAAQLELLPARAPSLRRASLHMADLTGHEHASPSRDLVELIAKVGLLQPVIVTGSARARYRVIEGRRRVKAIERLAAEGRWASPPRVDVLIVGNAASCPGVVQDGLALAMHAARSPSPASELSAIESILAAGAGGDEASAIRQIATQTGMPVGTVRRRLRLRALAPGLRAAFERGALGATVAEAVARLDAERQAEIGRLLEQGQRVTLERVRELARDRAGEAARALPELAFAGLQLPWRAIVRGHLQAALAAVPAEGAHEELARRIAAALSWAAGPLEPRDPPQEEPRRGAP